jgi:putative transposase
MIYVFKNADVNGARNILRKFKKSWHDVITGLKQTVRLRVFGKLKGSPEFAVYKQIGVVRCGDHLGRIRFHKTQTPTEATTS